MSGPDPSGRPALIDAFGEGGFRIVGARHEGGIVIVGGSVRPWAAREAKALAPGDFTAFFPPTGRSDLVVLGVGARTLHPPAAVRAAFREAGVGLEVLDTASACRVYNLLASEGRRVGAALIPV